MYTSSQPHRPHPPLPSRSSPGPRTKAEEASAAASLPPPPPPPSGLRRRQCRSLPSRPCLGPPQWKCCWAAAAVCPLTSRPEKGALKQCFFQRKKNQTLEPCPRLGLPSRTSRQRRRLHRLLPPSCPRQRRLLPTLSCPGGPKSFGRTSKCDELGRGVADKCYL